MKTDYSQIQYQQFTKKTYMKGSSSDREDIGEITHKPLATPGHTHTQTSTDSLNHRQTKSQPNLAFCAKFARKVCNHQPITNVRKTCFYVILIDLF